MTKSTMIHSFLSLKHGLVSFELFMPAVVGSQKGLALGVLGSILSGSHILLQAFPAKLQGQHLVFNWKDRFKNNMILAFSLLFITEALQDKCTPSIVEKVNSLGGKTKLQFNTPTSKTKEILSQSKGSAAFTKAPKSESRLLGQGSIQVFFWLI